MMIDKLKIVITNSHSAYIFQCGFIFLISFDGRRDPEAHPVCFFVIFQNASGKMNVRHKMNQCKHRYIVTQRLHSHFVQGFIPQRGVCRNIIISVVVTRLISCSQKNSLCFSFHFFLLFSFCFFHLSFLLSYLFHFQNSKRYTFSIVNQNNW